MRYQPDDKSTWVAALLVVALAVGQGLLRGAHDADWAWLFGGSLSSFLVMAIAAYHLRHHITGATRWVRLGCWCLLLALVLAWGAGYFILSDPLDNKARDPSAAWFALGLLPLAHSAAKLRPQSPANRESHAP